MRQKINLNYKMKTTILCGTHPSMNNAASWDQNFTPHT